MKTLFFVFLAICLLSACSKTNRLTTDGPFLEQARAFFEDSVAGRFVPGPPSNPRLNSAKIIDWSKAKVISSSKGKMVVVPVLFSKKLMLSNSLNRNFAYNISDVTRALFYKGTDGRFVCEEVTVLPDSMALYGRFSGYIRSEDWGGNPIGFLKYNPDGTVLRRTGILHDSLRSGLTTVQNAVTPDAYIVVETFEIGYNYSENDPDDVYYWVESVGTTIEYVPDSEGIGPSSSDYSSAAAGGGGSAQTVTVAIGPNPIGNIADYLKCFTNSGGSDHSYSVTVCVNQPIPGSRESWAFSDGLPGTVDASNPVNTGHSFLILSENYGGTTIVRNIGFYPSSFVIPGSPSASAQLDDNELTGYNISLTTKVSNAQFFNMLNYISTTSGATYNLYSLNCTTFVINALTVGDIYIPATTGYWVGGSGYDPGDLGEDIRNMPLNGNETRTTVSSYHPNIGSCN